MKKILIIIIIMLIMLLLGQLIYFNYRNNENTSQPIENNEATIYNNAQIPDNNTINSSTQITKTDSIIPEGINSVIEKYKGNVSIEDFEKELYTFVNTNVSKIYNLTTRKSINKILQIYDLNTEEINDMNIYSANDFLEITSQIFMVGNIEGVTCNGSYIDTNSYNDDENGYATFNLNLRYTNEESLNLKIYLANNSTTTPQLKFGVVEE